MAVDWGQGMSLLSTVIERELRLAWRHRSELVNPLLFFVLVVSLFPLAIGASPKLLQQIGPGVIWVAALLATLLGLEALFRPDHEDGSLEALLASPAEPWQWLLAKLFSHWLLTGLPLVLISPLLALLMHLQTSEIWALLWSLLLGTPVLSLLGSIGAALTLLLQRGGLLLSLLVLPLYIPVLIFGAGAVIAAQSGLDYSGQLAFLAALLVLASCLSPFALLSALKLSIH